MSCQLNDGEIQSWLDGESDQTQHLSECADCQQRLQAVQKLRSRLTPPPSPLGRDFARRTAQHVLRVTDVVKIQKPPTSWWGRLRENPLVHIVQRERNRRMLRIPNLVAILLLYLLPGAYVFQYGDVDARWAYFGMLQLGLTVLVPLFLLSIEWVTLSALVRGRCLEEMLQTGLEPVLVSDTLALNGLRSLLPALLVTALAVLPVHPQGLLQWFPMTLLAFSAAGYLSQAHLLALQWPRWLTLVGVGAVAGSLGAPAPWNLASALILTVMGYAARRQSVASLELQQQGRLPVRSPKRAAGGQRWLARRLPDLALLQRELRRRNLFTASVALGNLGLVVASYTMFATDAYYWPFFAAASALLAAFSLVNREKESGAYEVLVHSGLKFPDWWSSAAWLAGLQLAPACLTAGLVSCWQQWPNGLFSSLAAGLGTVLCLLVSLRAGAVIGTSVGINSLTARQAATRCVQEIAIIIVVSLVMVGILPSFLGNGSPLILMLGHYGLNLDQILSGLAILPVTLALHLRSRSLNGLELAVWNPWTGGLALGVPLCLWLQVSLYSRYGNGVTANFCAGSLILVGQVWAWWAAPLARRPDLKRWALLTASYALLALPALALSLWGMALTSSVAGEPALEVIPDLAGSQMLLYVLTVGCLVYPLATRLNWGEQPAHGSLRKRSLVASLLLASLTAWVGGKFYTLARAPLPQQGQFSMFLEKNSIQPSQPKLLKDLLEVLHASRWSDNYSNGFTIYDISANDLRLGSHDRLVNADILKPQSARFADLLQRMEIDEAAGNLLDRLYAFRILDVQLDQSLLAGNTGLVLRQLKSMAELCAQAQRGRMPAARNMASYLRGRVIVALRSQTWDLNQLSQIEQLQAGLHDDERSTQYVRDQQAVKWHAVVLTGGWNNQPPTHWLTRWYREKQAELFLNAYLADERDLSTQAPAGQMLRNLDFGWTRLSELQKLSLVMGREVLALERWRVSHGHYPKAWHSRNGDLRVVYQPVPDGYILKLWLHRPSGIPLVFTSRAKELQLQFY